MNEIIIKTQKEFDALPSSFEEYTRIIIRNDPKAGRISVLVAWKNASVVAYENASVVASRNASVVAFGNASVQAYENASVVASRNASVVAWGDASVTAYNNASVRAYENASVQAFGNASVQAYENASVQAFGNASVQAYENASVQAYGNASVQAYGNASVVARGNVGVYLHSETANVVLNMFAVCWSLVQKGNIEKKSQTASIIEPTPIKGVAAWLESQGIEEQDDAVILFKRVSSDLKTQEGTKNETSWSLGSILEHPAWSPEASECGEGKYHACSRPYFCDEFRSKPNDKYLAIKVSLEDLFFFTKAEYPHKIAFRKGEVLYEVNKMGGIK